MAQKTTREPKIPTVPKNQQVAWYINVDRCIACRACEGACKQQNNVDEGVRWRKVIRRESGQYPAPVAYNVSMACNHCAQPACIKSCPHGAISKRSSDGIVIIDQASCQGCKRCVWACPYGAPRYNSKTHKAEKCHRCYQRKDQGLPPACVVTCMGQALYAGTLEEMEAYSTQQSFSELPDSTYTNPNIRWTNPRRM